jgi:hypothetical protein
MRALLFAPLAVAVVAAGGVALMMGTGRNAHLPSMTNAAGTCLIATVLAAVPLIVARRGSQYALSQAGLVSTMVHLFVAVGVAAGMMLTGRLSTAYTYWLIPFYFATLIPLVVAIVRAIKHAPTATPAAGAGAPKA